MNKLDSTLTDFEKDDNIPYFTYKTNFLIENIKVNDYNDKPELTDKDFE